MISMAIEITCDTNLNPKFMFIIILFAYAITT